MTDSWTRTLAETVDAIAPDGMEVRLLAGGERGSMAEFRLAPGRTGKAVRHRTVEELWFILEGTGEMWREGVGDGATTLHPGMSLTVPVGRRFQLRNTGAGWLRAVGVTMPPWPLHRSEADEVEGIWTPDV